MEEEKKNVFNKFEPGSNCQVFNAPVTGCVFAMPGSTVTQQTGQPVDAPSESPSDVPSNDTPTRDAAELFRYIHPAIDSQQEWRIHDEVKRLVTKQGIQEICQYLKQMADEKRILLPQSPASAYAELKRMGMPNGDGFNEKTFQKYYRR